MRYNRYAQAAMSKRRGSFTAADKEASVEKFLLKDTNAKLWSMMDELSARLPWTKTLMTELKDYVALKECLTDGQTTLVVNLYMNSCVMSDESLAEQKAVRRLIVRLSLCNLDGGYRARNYGNGTESFVRSVKSFTDKRPFTHNQMSAVKKLAERNQSRLSQAPELTDENYDGWFLRQDKTAT
jgi:hypothetical protein